MNLKKLSLVTIAIFLFGCEHKATVPEINVELYGKWGNDSNCNLELIKNSKSIMVKQFSNGSHQSIENLPLNFKKNGVYTLFDSTNPKVDFKIVYVEGNLTIDKYCSEPLHKVDN
jgi:hypothetical protein